MKRLFLLVFVVGLPFALSATVKKKTAAPAKSHGKPSASSRKTSGHKTSGPKASGNRGVKKSVVPVQHSQAAPTPDRYREIQQALASKGYLKSDPTGSWDADTQDAMRRFQADKKLDQTGKIDAMSLISLGLGPQH